MPKPTPIQDLIDQQLLMINDGYRAKNAELSLVGLPFARAGNINNGFQFSEGAATDCFPIDSLEKVGIKISEPGDVVFTSKGTVGRFAFVRKETQRFVYAPQLCFWRSGDQDVIDPRWLYYWIQGREFYVQYKSVAGETDMAEYVSLRDQRRMQITLPHIDEQRRIAKILGALDDRIELNHQMNKTLESIVRAIFKSWFVDFDPVHAKAGGIASAGLTPESAALFPGSFEQAEIGLIPKGWSIKPISELTEGLYDGPHATPPKSETGAVFLGIKNLTKTQLDLSQVRRISEADWPRWTKRIEPKNGDIVFSYEATLGRFAVIPSGLRCCLGRRLALIRPHLDYKNTYFLFHTFVSDQFQRFLDVHTVPGATVDRISLSEFPGYCIVCPPIKIARLFERTAATFWMKINANRIESSTLVEKRNRLLRELFSSRSVISDNLVQGLEEAMA